MKKLKIYKKVELSIVIFYFLINILILFCLIISIIRDNIGHITIFIMGLLGFGYIDYKAYRDYKSGKRYEEIIGCEDYEEIKGNE